MRTASRWLGVDPFVFVGAALAVFAVLAVLGWQLQSEDDPVRPRVFRGEVTIDDAPAADVAGSVSAREGDVVTVQGEEGPVPVRLPAGTLIQTLRPESVGGVSPGEWVLVGGLDDNVNAFIIQGIVVAAESEVR